MNRKKRAIAIALTVMLLAQSLCIGALAGDDGPLGGEEPPTLVFDTDIAGQDANGMSVNVFIDAPAAGDDTALKGIIANLQPYVLVLVGDLDAGAEGVLNNQVEFIRIYYTADNVSGNTATVNILLPCGAIYGLQVVDNTGELAGDRLSDGSYAYSSTSFLEVPEWTGEQDVSGSGSSNGSDYSDLYNTYTSVFEEILSGAGISSVAGLQAAPDVTTSLLQMTNELNGILVSEGQPDLGEYMKTYLNGKYLDIYNYVVSFDGDASGAETPVLADVFTDVAADAWYAEPVYMAVDMGLVTGKGDGVFAPNDNMTIAEAITLAVRFDTFIKGTDSIANTSGSSPWYQPYLDYAEENGLPWQYSDYNAKITRDEFAYIFAAVYEANKSTFDAQGLSAINIVVDGAIPDVPMSSSYANDIYTLYRLGVLGGSDAARNFKPSTNIQRCEVATILCRLADVGRQEFTLE